MHVGYLQHVAGIFNFQTVEVGQRTTAGLLLEECGEASRRIANVGEDVLQGNAALNVLLHEVDGCIDYT